MISYTNFEDFISIYGELTNREHELAEQTFYAGRFLHNDDKDEFYNRGFDDGYEAGYQARHEDN